MQYIFALRRRFGLLLERRGMLIKLKKLYRLYLEEGSSVQRRRDRKRARNFRSSMPLVLVPNQRWSLDLVADTFGASRSLRILAVMDDCCRESLCLIAGTSILGAEVARELDALVRVAICARYPIDLQNPKSVEDQIASRRALAHERGWWVVAEYFEGRCWVRAWTARTSCACRQICPVVARSGGGRES